MGWLAEAEGAGTVLVLVLEEDSICTGKSAGGDGEIAVTDDVVSDWTAIVVGEEMFLPVAAAISVAKDDGRREWFCAWDGSAR